jgi:hypothetical protein
MANNPFITQTSPMMGQTLIDPESLALQRQKQYAAALLQQNQQPQGQMVSGRYVAPSWTQQLNATLNPLLGAYMMNQADTKQTQLAEALRQQGERDLQAYGQAVTGRAATPDVVPQGQTMRDDQGELTMGSQMGTAEVKPNFAQGLSILRSSRDPETRALGKALMADMFKTQKVGEGESLVRQNFDGGFTTVGQGAEKFRAPLQVDTGTTIEFRDPKDPTKVLQVVQKSQMPTGGQIYESSEGPLIVNTKTNTATPLLGADGKPLSPKLSSEQSKDITAINQQKSVISSALDLVQQNPTAFSFKRGAAVLLPFGETLAGRTETAPETEARATVFNIVSKVINERAGAAQSAQELKRLNAFLPSEFDNAQKIQDKLKGFNKYLEEQEKGVRAPTSKAYTPASSNVFGSEADAQKAFNEGKLKVGQKITINGVTGTWR